MKRLLLFGVFVVLMLSFTSTASAATIYGKVENAAQYDRVIVCGIDYSYADAFTPLISGQSATDPRTTLSVLTFLRDHSPACVYPQKDGSFSINFPDKQVYLVIVALSNDNHSYWFAEQVDASVTQVITTTAPSF